MLFAGLKSIQWLQTQKNFQIMFLGINDQEIVFISDEKVIKSTSSVKFLGILRDNKLNFSKYVKNICKSVS